MRKGTSGARVHIGESMGNGPSHGSAQRTMIGKNMAPGVQRKFVTSADTNVMDNRGQTPKIGGGMKKRESSEE